MIGAWLCGTAFAQTPLSVSVRNNRLFDGNGATLILRGVNRSSSEWACKASNGAQVFHGLDANDAAAVTAEIEAMKKWRINAVRIPLNEAC